MAQSARQFSRYLNRGQKAAIEMKTDLNAYDQLPKQISRVVPGPSYPDKAMPNQAQQFKRRNSAYDLERIRTSGIARIEKERRFINGRLQSHEKLEMIKQEVAKVRNTESQSGIKDVSLGIQAPDVIIDDQF